MPRTFLTIPDKAREEEASGAGCSQVGGRPAEGGCHGNSDPWRKLQWPQGSIGCSQI